MKKILLVPLFLVFLLGCAQERSGNYVWTYAFLDRPGLSVNRWEVFTVDYVLSIDQQGQDVMANLALETPGRTIAFETESAEASRDGTLTVSFSHNQDGGIFADTTLQIALEETDASDTGIDFRILQGRELLTNEEHVDSVVFSLESSPAANSRRETAQETVLVSVEDKLRQDIEDGNFESAEAFMSLLARHEYAVPADLEIEYTKLKSDYETEQERRRQEYSDTLFGRNRQESGWR